MKQILRPSGGHILDVDPIELPENVLTLAHNVHMRKRYPTRINGRRICYADTTYTALHLLNLSLNTFNWWMLFGEDSILAVETSNEHDISYASQLEVTDSREWVSTLLNGIPVFTNGKNPALFWDGNGSNPVDALADWPASTVCKGIVAFRFHLFAYNIDGPSGIFDNQILWSDAAEPGALPDSWTPAPDNEAGSAILADEIGRIITARPLNDQLLFYKPNSVYAAEYIGQQPDNIFRVRPISRTIGALGPHTVLTRGQQHFVVGNDDIILTDGVNASSIADNRIKQYLSNSIDETNAANSFVVRDLNKREWWICVPEAGSQFATVAHVWDEKRDTWVTRDLNSVRYGTTGFVTDTSPSDVWDNAVGVWDTDIALWNSGTDAAIPRVVTAEIDNLYLEETADATAVAARLRKGDLIFGDADFCKLTSRVWIDGSGVDLAGVRFRLGTRNSTDEEVVWGDFRMREPDGTPYEVNGKFIWVEIETTGTESWTIDRITIEAVYNGS